MTVLPNTYYLSIILGSKTGIILSERPTGVDHFEEPNNQIREIQRSNNYSKH